MLLILTLSSLSFSLAAESLADISTNLDVLAIKKRGLELGLEWASANNPLDPQSKHLKKC